MSKLAELKSRDTDRQAINDWLDRIGENDQACRDEVLEYCKNDPDARRFYVQKAKGEIN